MDKKDKDTAIINDPFRIIIYGVMMMLLFSTWLSSFRLFSDVMENAAIKRSVHGIQDMEIQITDEYDFKKDLFWFDNHINDVYVDSSKVDLTKVGEYPLVYTIDYKADGRKDRIETVTVKVVEHEVTKKEIPKVELNEITWIDFFLIAVKILLLITLLKHEHNRLENKKQIIY